MKHQVTCLPETQDATPALVDALKSYLRQHPVLVEALGKDARVYDGNVDWRPGDPAIILFHSSSSRPAFREHQQHTDLVFLVKHTDQRRVREIANILIDAIHACENHVRLRPPAELVDAQYHGHRVFPAGGAPMDASKEPHDHYRAWVEFNFWLSFNDKAAGRDSDKVVQVAAGPRTGSAA